MDPITDIITAVRVESVCYGRLNATAPWGLRINPAGYAVFSYVAQGAGWMNVDGIRDPFHFAPGDFFLLAPGRQFTLQDNISSELRELDDELREKFRHSLPWGGGGSLTSLICGKFLFGETHSGILADLLPPVIHVSANDANTATFAKTLELLADETRDGSAASQLVMHRLADVLFLQAIRAHIAAPHEGTTGWVRALGDPQIGASLRSMHNSIERDWTVAALASDVGMSRSAYAQRFKILLGEGPLEYLTRWRMYRAAEMLSRSDQTLIDVARAVGYDSDSAFQRVFKRVHSAPPGAFRRRHTPGRRPPNNLALTARVGE